MILDIDQFLRVYGSRGVTGVTTNPPNYRENRVTPVTHSDQQTAGLGRGLLLREPVALAEAIVVRVCDAADLPLRWCGVATRSHLPGDLAFGCGDAAASCGVAPLATFSFEEAQLMAALASHGCAQQTQLVEWTNAKVGSASAVVTLEQWAYDAASITSWALGDLLRHFELRLHSVCVESEQAASARRSGVHAEEFKASRAHEEWT